MEEKTLKRIYTKLLTLPNLFTAWKFDLSFLRDYNIWRVGRVRLLIATVGYAGYLPYAPGTFGSLLGLLLISLLKPHDLQLLLIFPFLFIIGAASADSAERFMGKDSPHIVIDEFCGYLITMVFLPKDLAYLIAGFLLFRLFDILKPPPIKRIEGALKGGIAIMADDLLAGLYANLCLQLWRLIS
jgi:phosphatidylglycerophosphatase A